MALTNVTSVENSDWWTHIMSHIKSTMCSLDIIATKILKSTDIVGPSMLLISLTVGYCGVFLSVSLVLWMSPRLPTSKEKKLKQKKHASLATPFKDSHGYHSGHHNSTKCSCGSQHCFLTLRKAPASKLGGCGWQNSILLYQQLWLAVCGCMFWP